MLIRTLEGFGVDDVDEAEDGQQAIEWVQRKTYDLIIVDHHMPNHLGTDVILEARAEVALAQLSCRPLTVKSLKSCVRSKQVQRTTS